VDIERGVPMNSIPWDVIIAKLEALGAKLTDAAAQGFKYLYPLAVRQQIITGATYAIVGVILLAATVGFVILAKYCARRRKEEGWASCWEFGVGFAATCAVVAVITGICFLCSAVPCLLNPEWYAIQEVIGLLK
jgi:hypothetical protein